jgi:hypothetical protein
MWFMVVSPVIVRKVHCKGLRATLHGSSFGEVGDVANLTTRVRVFGLLCRMVIIFGKTVKNNREFIARFLCQSYPVRD